MKRMWGWELRWKEYLWDQRRVWRRFLVALVPLAAYIVVLLLLRYGL